MTCRKSFATSSTYTKRLYSPPRHSSHPFPFIHFIQLRTCRYACRGITSGLRFDRAKASAASWEIVSVRIMLPMDIKNPKVAPEPIIYCPSVRPTPFGPAPYLMMLTEPNIKPIMTPTVLPIIAPIFHLSKADGPPMLAPTGTGILTGVRLLE